VHKTNDPVCPYDEAVPLNFGKSVTPTSIKHGRGVGKLRHLIPDYLSDSDNLVMARKLEK